MQSRNGKDEREKDKEERNAGALTGISYMGGMEECKDINDRIHEKRTAYLNKRKKRFSPIPSG